MTDCILWNGHVEPCGYGRIRVDGRRAFVHRIVWEWAHARRLCPGEFVLHHCDVRRCVNPLHLFLGTKGDNNRDRALKGRSSRGEIHPRAKMTEDDVRAIRAARATGRKGAIREVIEARGLPRYAPYKTHINWKHLEEQA